MYEWCVIMFSDEVTRYVNEKDGFDNIKLLTTTLSKPVVVNNANDKIDHLGDCIDDIFYSIDTIKTTMIADQSVNNNSSSTYDEVDNAAIEDNSVPNDDTNDDSNRGKIHSLSLITIFDQTKN